MAKGLYKEKIEYLKARFMMKEGLFEWLLSSLVMGYFFVNYTNVVYSWIHENLLYFIGYEMIRDYIAYLVFGLFLLPVGIFLTLVLTKLYKFLFGRNGRAF